MTSMFGFSPTSDSTGVGHGKGSTGGNIIPKGYRQGQLQQFSPEQMNLFQSLFSQVQPDSFLSRLAGGDQSSFERLEAPALKQFGQLQGNIASRFSGMGGLGGRKSSGFQNTLNSAGSDFAQQLQSQRMGLQRQALIDLMGISESLLGQRPYEQFLIKKQQKTPWWQKLLGGALPIGGAALGGAFGGPAGASLGGQLGGSFASGFMD